MAKAIELVPVPAHNPDGVREELQRKLAAAPLEHAEALLSLWELLQIAEDRQVIDIAKGLLATSDNLVEKLAAGANMPGSIRAMRNGLLLAELLGALDPETLKALVQALPSAVKTGSESATIFFCGWAANAWPDEWAGGGARGCFAAEVQKVGEIISP